jgi:hypothetical protein
MLARQLPTHRNREFFAPLQGIKSGDQGIYSPDQGIARRTCCTCVQTGPRVLGSKPGHGRPHPRRLDRSWIPHPPANGLEVTALGDQALDELGTQRCGHRIPGGMAGIGNSRPSSMAGTNPTTCPRRSGRAMPRGVGRLMFRSRPSSEADENSPPGFAR